MCLEQKKSKRSRNCLLTLDVESCPVIICCYEESRVGQLSVGGCPNGHQGHYVRYCGYARPVEDRHGRALRVQNTGISAATLWEKCNKILLFTHVEICSFMICFTPSQFNNHFTRNISYVMWFTVCILFADKLFLQTIQ